MALILAAVTWSTEAFDRLDVEIWSNFTHDLGMFELGECLNLHYCDAESDEVYRLISSIQLEIITTDFPRFLSSFSSRSE